MLSGKVAVITGGASGIGEATARLFVRERARVVIADVQIERAQELAEELGGEDAVAVACDVTKEEDVKQLVDTAIEAFKGLDIMCNNAGVVGRMGVRQALLEDLDMEEYDQTVQVNQRGIVLGTKHAARAMIAAKTRGVIINTSSVAGLRVTASNSGDPPLVPAGYVASKSAVVALTKLAAAELAPHGIRVNAVAPGSTCTPMVAKVFPGEPKLQEVEDILKATSILKGVATMPEDIANGMLYLASDMGRCVNGHTLVIDCGLCAGVSGIVPALST